MPYPHRHATRRAPEAIHPGVRRPSRISASPKGTGAVRGFIGIPPRVCLGPSNCLTDGNN